MAIEWKRAILVGTTLFVLTAACSSSGTSDLSGFGSGSLRPSSSATPITTATAGTNATSGAASAATPSPTTFVAQPQTVATPQGGSGGLCITGQLTLTAGRPDGAAGSVYTTFYFVNTGRQSCTLQGFPGVSVLDPAGDMVGQAAARSGPAGQPVGVAPGSRAQFIVRTSGATRPGCPTPNSSTQIQVYPPDQTAPLRIPFATASCVLSVSAITP